MRTWLRWLKYIGLALAIVLLTPVVFMVSVWLAYRHTVSAVPGSLAVDATSGVMGAEVNVFSGTGGFPWVGAHNSPCAQTPFGMARPGPDTASLLVNKAALNYSGYYYGDNKLIGFSNTRIPGAGVMEGGNLRIFPTTRGDAFKDREKKPYARFSHRHEKGFPGYYGVLLPKEDILVELTATPHVAVHRYTFAAGSTPHLILDVTSATGDKHCKEGVLKMLPDGRGVEGSLRTFGSFSGRYGGLELFFAARFNRPVSGHTVWFDGNTRAGAEGAVGDDAGVCLAFPSAGEKQAVEVYLAISSVSIANARENLAAEVGEQGFEQVLDAAKRAWEQPLQRMLVQGGTRAQRRIFYTALYRAFQAPTHFSDVTGAYRGFDQAVHQADGFKYYTDFSLWDTFRTVHPLFNLIARDEQRDMMRSLLEMARAGGSLPRWPAGAGYTGSMFGTPADMTLTEAYLKGVRDFDIEEAYGFMRRTALEGVPADCRCDKRDGLEWYLDLGYCPDDKMSESVASTLEYAWADYSLSLLAGALGKSEDAEVFARHARSYRNLWNPQSRYFHPKDSQGVFFKDLRPDLITYLDFDHQYTRGYVEGSARQWRWGVPFDAAGLVELTGPPDRFVDELETYMEGTVSRLGNWNPGPHYWHGNEPYFHAAYLFLEAGRPDLTQKWVRRLLETKYADNYVGLDGNDDCGTLSAWYVLSALGLYPIAGTARYWIGAPLFERAEVRLGPIEKLVIVAENHAAEHPYVQGVWLNDVVLDRFWLEHEEIAAGGVLKFKMGPDPAAAP